MSCFFCGTLFKIEVNLENMIADSIYARPQTEKLKKDEFRDFYYSDNSTNDINYAIRLLTAYLEWGFSLRTDESGEFNVEKRDDFYCWSHLGLLVRNCSNFGAPVGVGVEGIMKLVYGGHTTQKFPDMERLVQKGFVDIILIDSKPVYFLTDKILGMGKEERK